LLLENIFSDINPSEQILVTHRPHAGVGLLPGELVDGVVNALAYRDKFKDHDCFFGVAPRIRGLKETVSRVTCVWADIDSKDFGSSEKAKASIQAIPASPTCLVFSGHGYHSYWKLQSPVTPEKAQEIMRSFCNTIGSDPTHHAGWRLRIPGSTNFKEPDHPVPVKVMEFYENLTYNPNDLLKFCKVSQKIKDMMWSGAISNKKLWNYRSRSERDLVVIMELVKCKVSDAGIEQLCLSLPFGERIQEDGGLRLLHNYDLPRAKDRANRTLSTNFQEDKNSCYWYITETKRKRVSTFVIDPKKLLRSVENNEDIIFGTVRSMDKEVPNQAFPRSVFNSTMNFLKQMKNASWQWLGTDFEVRSLLPALMDRLREDDAPTAYGTQVLGRHKNYWTTQGITFDAHKLYEDDEAPYVYIPTGRNPPKLRYEFPNPVQYEKLVQNIFNYLPKINYADVMTPIIGWFFATPLATVFWESGIQFPHLNIVGTTGSGKTTTVESIFLPLFGYDPPTAYSYHTTRFSLLSLFGSTNAIPISFGDYRALARSQRHADFLDIMRTAYNRQEDMRGRQDQTTVTYPLIAPVCVDGEDALEDGTGAIKERALIVNLHPETIKEGSSRYEALKTLIEYPLNLFAGRYIQFTLEYGCEEISNLFNESMSELFTVFSDVLPDRLRRNLAVSVVGIKLYNEFAKRYEAPPIVWDRVDFMATLDNIMLKTVTGGTRIAVDSFVEDVVNYVSLRSGLERFRWRYDAADNVLWIPMYAAYGWWRVERGRQGRDPIEYKAVIIQLKERENKYVIGTKPIPISGETYRCTGIHLGRAFKCGLETPDCLSLHTEISDVKEDYT